MKLISRLAVVAVATAAVSLPSFADVPHHILAHVPAHDSNWGWEHQSYPLGCGHFGWNVFGIVTNERVQVTHNAVATKRNLSNALEIRLKMDDVAATDYERRLDLSDAILRVRYTQKGVAYTREYFTSYPDRVGVMRFTASQKGALAFALSAEIPHCVPYGDKEGHGKRGSTSVLPDGLMSFGEIEYSSLKYAARLKVETDGTVSADSDKGTFAVKNATTAVVYFACETNYELKPSTFVPEDVNPKMPDRDVRGAADALVAAAAQKGVEALRRDHVRDYRFLADRVKLDLGADPSDAKRDTAALVADYAKGRRSAYLEETYYAYGRYLLIASSRPGALPANLQGVWNVFDRAPWGGGYVHNINVQMNYWPAFPANLMECFESYAAFNAAFRPQARENALTAIRNFTPENLPKEGEAKDMWEAGLTVFPFEVAAGPGGNSGPAIGGLTTKLFKDWWDFTRDPRVLKEHAYPAHHGMADFLSRCVRDYDGLKLSAFSASPEQVFDGPWHPGPKKFVQTIGCAFDQQLIDGNGRDFLELKAAAGAPDDEVSRRVNDQLDHYDPIQIGWSGQIKEYREEGYYGEFGEYRHRHLSHLMALSPGTRITRETPAWLDAAKVALDGRGDKSTGWALAHRICAWARTGDGDRAYRLICNLLAERTYENLWDTHPPFQIDGNFGALHGMTEMLIQSHAGAIDVLPALPKSWPKGSVSGLRARGGYEVDLAWEDGVPRSLTVRAPANAAVPIVRFDGRVIAADAGSTKDRYVYTAFPKVWMRPAAPSAVTVDRKTRQISWKPSTTPNVTYRVLRNENSAPDYVTVAECVRGTEIVDADLVLPVKDYVTYKVVAVGADGVESVGALHTCSRATTLEKARYILNTKNLNGITIDPASLD